MHNVPFVITFYHSFIHHAMNKF